MKCPICNGVMKRMQDKVRFTAYRCSSCGEELMDMSQLKQLVDEIDPIAVSDHLSWSSVDGQFFNDLLPLPYTEEALVHFCRKVEQVQEYLGRQMLIENPSSYLKFSESTWSEPEFLREVARRTGCGLLLDVNNVFVSAINL